MRVSGSGFEIPSSCHLARPSLYSPFLGRTLLLVHGAIGTLLQWWRRGDRDIQHRSRARPVFHLPKSEQEHRTALFKQEFSELNQKLLDGLFG